MTIIIPLTKDQVTIVDDEDADLAQVKWTAKFTPKYANGGKYTAYRHVGGRKNRVTLQIHRVILARKLGRPLLPKEEVDHMDLNPLNNQRYNLRLATRSQNAMNRTIQSNNKSGYKGVCWKTKGRK